MLKRPSIAVTKNAINEEFNIKCPKFSRVPSNDLDFYCG